MPTRKPKVSVIEEDIEQIRKKPFGSNVLKERSEMLLREDSHTAGLNGDSKSLFLSHREMTGKNSEYTVSQVGTSCDRKESSHCWWFEGENESMEPQMDIQRDWSNPSSHWTRADQPLHRSPVLHSSNIQTQSSAFTIMNLISVSPCKVHRSLPETNTYWRGRLSEVWHQTESWYYGKSRRALRWKSVKNLTSVNEKLKLTVKGSFTVSAQ